MYEYIKGMYAGLNKDYIIIENNNIGYRIFTSGSTMANLPKINSDVTIHIEQIVREDSITLYGFLSKEEIVLFNNLININGVGPKAALSIMSVSSVYNIKKAIAFGDEKLIIKAQGIGKKIAQRIILELKDKFIKDFNEDNMAMEDGQIISSVSNINADEAKEALLSLGYSEKEVDMAMKSVNVNDTVESIIKDCLKVLMG